MLQKFRQRAEDESGFTLIELLVVILIIGILTAIAIPPFLNQPSTASDTATKSQLDRAQRAEKTYATDHGTYTGKASDLRRIEPSLANAPAVTPSLSATGYTLVATSTGPGGTTPVTYTLRVANGLTTHTCTPASTGGCAAAGKW